MKVNHYFAASSLEEAYQAISTNPQSMIIGGGAWMKLTYKIVDTLVSLDHLHLDTISESNGMIEIGSMTTLHQLETHPLIHELHHGILSDAVKQIMGIALRNIATIGGSIVSKFGFSDLLPVLLLMNPTLHFYHFGAISLQQFLKTNDIKRDILVSISIPYQNYRMYFKKVKTTALDFAILNVAVAKRKEGYMIAIGSRPAMSELATNSMDYLNGLNQVTTENLEAAAKMAVSELRFSANVRSGQEYREHLANVYTLRGLKEVSSL